MPRKGPVKKREVEPDLKYGEPIVTKLINKVMMRGQKRTAERIVYECLDIIARKTGQDPLVVLRKALNNVRPLLEVRPRRVGGATYQVPIEVPEERSFSLAFRWIVNFARLRKEKTMQERLANEIIDASNKVGAAIKKREDVHRMAEGNKAFAHYRW